MKRENRYVYRSDSARIRRSARCAENRCAPKQLSVSHGSRENCPPRKTRNLAGKLQTLKIRGRCCSTLSITQLTMSRTSTLDESVVARSRSDNVVGLRY